MEQCFTLATTTFFPEGEVSETTPSQPSLRLCEIVRASITQISLIQSSGKFSNLPREIRRAAEALHLSHDR